jgi:hypothetical protein
MPVTYSPTGAERKPKTKTTTQEKEPSWMEKLSTFLRRLNDTSGVNAGTYGYQRQQPVRFRRQNTMPSSGQKALTMPTRDRFQDGDPRADRRVSYTPTGQVRENPYTPPVQYQFSNDEDPRKDRRPALGRYNPYNPEGYIPLPWWYGDLNSNQGAGAGNLNGGYGGGLGSRISYGGGGGGGRGGSGGNGYPGQRMNTGYVPQWIQQMVNWRM